MKRKEFINFALLFAAAHHLPLPAAQDESFRFDFSSINELLKKVPATERETASLMIKNLLYDMEHIFRQATDKTDLAVLKKLAEEADQKFYAENKLKADSFKYQSLSIADLESMEKNTGLKAGEFDAMVKTLKSYSKKLGGSREKFEKLLPGLLEEATKAAEKQKEAEEKGECTKVLSIVAAVVIVVVAVVVAAFTFGAAGAFIALAVIAAAAIIGGVIANPNSSELMGAMIGAALVSIVCGGKTLFEEKVKISWTDFDKKVKCAFLSAVNAITLSGFSIRSYPSRPLMGSLAVNIFGISRQIPGIETQC